MAAYMGVVGEIIQMGVMRSIVPALYESVVGIEPVIAIGSQRPAPPFFADVQAAVVSQGQSEADMVRDPGRQDVNGSDQLIADSIGGRNSVIDARHVWVST